MGFGRPGAAGGGRQSAELSSSGCPSATAARLAPEAAPGRYLSDPLRGARSGQGATPCGRAGRPLVAAGAAPARAATGTAVPGTAATGTAVPGTVGPV